MKAPTLDPRLDARLADAERRLAGVEEALASPEVLSSPDKLRELGKERAHLDPIVTTGRALRGALEEHPVLERARLRFVGVADEVSGSIVVRGHERPLEPRRKARSPTALGFHHWMQLTTT